MIWRTLYSVSILDFMLIQILLPSINTKYLVGPVAKSVKRLATGWTVRGSNPGGGEIFRTCPDRHWGPPSLLYNGYRVFPGVKCGRGVTLTSHPLLVPWSRKGRAIPLLPLWAVRPVQSLSACTRVHFTFTFTFYHEIFSEYISPLSEVLACASCSFHWS